METLARTIIWCSCLLLACLFLKFLASFLKWILKERQIVVMEKKYEALMSRRADLLHHYYLAVEEKNLSFVEEMKPKIVSVTREIDILRNSYSADHKAKGA